MTQRMTIEHIIAKKKKGEKITMLTAYDYPSARVIDRCGVDMILVGDSLAQVVLGLDSTRQVGMTEMLHHAKAVNRAVEKAFLVGDMPYGSYQPDVRQAVDNARRFVEEAGCNAVKLEWFDRCPDAAAGIVAAGIPVMGHVGLTPQTAEEKGGFKLQGKNAEAAKMIIEQAQALEAQGCFALVLECIPDKIAGIITRKVSIPTIGIGAGAFCDGQVLVTPDVLGLFDRFRPKFAKQYVDVSELMAQGVAQFCREVREGRFPDDAHSYPMRPEEFHKLEDL